MERVSYTQFEGGFNQIVLEESFVLNLKTTMSFVDFHMNFAVNEHYPLYVAPETSETHHPRHLDDAEGDEYELQLVDDDGNEVAGDIALALASQEETPANAAGAIIDTPAESETLTANAETPVNYPYRRGRIFFPNMEQVFWRSRIQPYIDPGSGSVDYGAIDYFYQGDEGRYFLAGYWGELEILSGPPILEIDELKAHLQNQPRPQNQQQQPKK